MSRRGQLVLLLACSVYLVQSLPKLTSVPRAIADESWSGAQGFAVATEGRLRNPVVQGRYGMDRAFIQPRLPQSLALGLTYRLLGFSLWSGRFASVVVGFLTVLGVYHLMRAWFHPGRAALVSLLFATDTWFFIVSRVVRDEVYLLCVGTWALAILARAAPRFRLTDHSMPCSGCISRVLCFLAGLLGGVACYTHPNGVLIALLLPILMAIQVGFGRTLVRPLLALLVGGITALLPFVIFVAYSEAKYDVSFIQQLGQFHTRALELHFTDMLAREWDRWLYFLAPKYRWPWIVVLAASAVSAVRWRHPAQVWALVMIIGHMLLMFALIRSPSSKYLVILSPWFAVLVVQWSEQLCAPPASENQEGISRSIRRVIGRTGIVVTLGVMLSANAYMHYVYRNADYDVVCRRIEKSLPSTARVYGNLVFWTGLYGHPFLSNTNEPPWPLETVGPRFRTRLTNFAPEYVIREADLCWSLGGFGPRKNSFANRSENRGAITPYGATAIGQMDAVLDELVARHGRLVEAFTTFDFGAIEIYQMEWE